MHLQQDGSSRIHHIGSSNSISCTQSSGGAGFTSHPFDGRLLCDGHAVGRAYDKLIEDGVVNSRHPCILYSHNKIRQNYEDWVQAMMHHSKEMHSPTVLNCVYNLEHNSCAEAVAYIHSMSQEEHSGTLVMQISNAHEFDVVEAVIPKVLYTSQNWWFSEAHRCTGHSV